MNVAAWRMPLGFGALCLLALPAGAVSLGDIEVRSRAGAPLEARIPVLTAKDEPLRGACFSLASRGATSLPGPSLELRRSSRGASLFVRTRGPLEEGAAFAIAITCPGAPSAPAVEYAVRFPAPTADPPPVASRVAAPLPVVMNLAVREGDTLASLAEVFFPRDRVVRARYLEAIRAQNAALAAIGDEEPLEPGMTIALPDLHAFAATLPVRHAAASRAAASPRVAHAPVHRSAAGSATALAAAASAPAAKERVPSPPRRDEPRAGAAEGFRLRLSAPVIDLAPSRAMDERKRAELRERLLVLESDDRTAAMLAMREDIRRLESQVRQLKLRLATLAPAAGPAPESAKPVDAAPPKADATPPAPPSVDAAAEAPRAEAPKTPAPGAQAPKAIEPKPEAPGAAATETAKATPAPGAAPKAREEPIRPVVIPRAPGEEPWYSSVLWWLRLLLVPLAGVLGLRYFARRRAFAIDDYAEEEIAPDLAVTEPGAEGHAADTDLRHDTDIPSEPVPQIATRVPAEDNVELRRRYIEERFPEIANGAVVLDDPLSVVKAARLLHDDGAIARAVELLQFAIEREPDAMPAWLALFALFRLQGLSGEFAELARRFAERHGASDEWRDVRAIGRTLDPANPLYEGEEVVAAIDGGPEGWLHGADDTSRGGLAAELRSRLMDEASVTDTDLAPDPIPALRKAEIFSVA